MQYDSENITISAIRDIKDFSGMVVLEVGCGTGNISVDLAEGTELYVGIDTDREAIEKAKKNLSIIDFKIGNGEQLEFINEAFDIVLFTLSLHHQNSVRALTEAFRVLKKGGTLIILEPTTESDVTQLCNLFEDETKALIQTRENIINSNLTVQKSKVYVKMEFCNLEELCSYHFGRTRFNPDDRSIIIKQLKKMGVNFENAPIILREIIAIYNFTK